MRISLTVMLVLMVLFSGCRMTRYVPDDEYLLKDVTVKVDNDDIEEKELEKHLRQRENLKILGFIRFHLWLYNMSSKKREKGILKNIGEPPVIYDIGLKNKSSQQLLMHLHNKGYYRASINDSVSFSNKTATVNYAIKTGQSYRVRTIDYIVNDRNLLQEINEIRREAIISNDDILDVGLLENERKRISDEFRNRGYFKFSEDFIHFQIDTTNYEYQADIDLIIEDRSILVNSNYSQHKKFTVDSYSFYMGGISTNIDEINNVGYKDTIQVGDFLFHYNKTVPIKEKVLLKTIEMFPGDIYQKRLEDKMYNNLYALRQFKYVNIQFDEEHLANDSLHGRLNARVYLPLQTRQNYSFDIEGTNASGDLGVAGNLNYQHRNLFRGAEIFDITLRGATERQVTGIDDQKFNTIEYGGSMRLRLPGFLFPINEQKLKLHSIPFTSISLAYNYQRRPDYTRTVVNARLGYQWRSSIQKSHSFNLLDLNAVRIFSLNESFINSIEDLYIKSSYTDHIIYASNYSFVYNTQSRGGSANYKYFKVDIEAAGNFLFGLSNVLNRSLVASSSIGENGEPLMYYEYFGTRFSQYLRGDFEWRYGYRFDKYNKFAARAFVGVAYPYGNSNLMPFERQYFTGGANGIRAWHVRSIGPGTYSPTGNAYPNQTSDIKLEANIEYRFQLFWMLEGALFVDAGNIWAINRFDNREGAVFEFYDFYNEIAVGSGAGLRLVLPYFVLRADVGVKLRSPSLPLGQRWIHTSKAFSSDDLNFNIAIGYPF
ncbi:MAG: BamA/TamA family outer membrane protein [Prolixibacteraceae bacterium]|jgi:outer membrane protein assembly factor BamA|nr:BamA/TamA family outer membrane protein [Prolixibacteraceae bacterium]